jgi:hypothetical protein
MDLHLDPLRNELRFKAFERALTFSGLTGRRSAESFPADLNGGFAESNAVKLCDRFWPDSGRRCSSDRGR